jgi:hypothetical protein
MPEVRFEPTIPVFMRANTVHALDRAATVIGQDNSVPARIRTVHLPNTKQNLTFCLNLLVTFLKIIR